MPEIQSCTALAGTVVSILFYNEMNGYTVAELETQDAIVPIVGEIGALEPGEEVELTGSYITHPRYGTQFRAESCVRTLPSTAANIERYLASGIIPGIRKRMAQRIVAEFGEFTLEIMEHHPEKLSRIKGISARQCEDIAAAVKEIFGMRNLMEKLQDHNISPAYAMRAYRRWGVVAWDAIRENPYRLCLPGLDLDFCKAEQLAKALEVSPEHPNRLAAGMRWLLQAAALDGHTCLPYQVFLQRSVKLLEQPVEVLQSVYQFCLDEGRLFAYETAEGVFVYADIYYRAEDFIAERMDVMLAFSPKEDFDCKAAIQAEEKRSGITYADLQKQAIACAFSRGIMILTGGPGTGKTAALNAVIRLCEQAGSVVQLAAPTGRAAMRMTELTGREAKTIHRLLGVEFDENDQLSFHHNEQEPINADVVIVDEVSMVDTLLFEALLRALRISCRLVLVGDEEQLPSVGAGNLLHSLIACERIPVVRLTEIFRQAQESMIVRSAHQIVAGNMPDLRDRTSDFFFFDRRNANEAKQLVLELYSKRLPNRYGYVPARDIQVITPTRKGILGVEQLNPELQAAVNPAQYGKITEKTMLYAFREGDKVMQTKNQYEMEWTKDGEHGTGIFNGDIGMIEQIDHNSHRIYIDFDGRKVILKPDQLDLLELAYAVTVHKSQGSEYEAVILVLPDGADKLSYRSLLYTAVTRAKNLLIVIGSPMKFREMVGNRERTVRYSCLETMLRVPAATPMEDVHEPQDIAIA